MSAVFVQADYDILLIGQPGHDEVIGTRGEAPDRIQVVTGPDDAGRVVVRDPARVVWLSQTTLSVDETAATVACLRRRFPLLTDPPSDDICYAAQNRQNAVKQIARQADLVLVVGSATSHNSTQLVRVALAAGAAAAHLVGAGECRPRPPAGTARTRADCRTRRPRRAAAPAGPEVVPGVVGAEVAVPHLSPAVW